MLELEKFELFSVAKRNSNSFIGIKLIIKKFRAINLTSRSFVIDYILCYKFRVNEIKCPANSIPDNLQVDLLLSNSNVSEHFERRRKEEISIEDGKAYAYIQRDLSTTFFMSCSSQLSSFPFDRHKCCITIIYSGFNKDKRVFCELDEGWLNNEKLLREYENIQNEWIICQPLIRRFRYGDKEHFQMAVPIHRRPDYYLFHVLPFSTFVGSMSLLILAVDPSDLSTRLNYLITVALTQIASLFTANYDVPISDKMHWIQYYMIVSIVFLFLFMIGVTIISEPDYQYIDMYFKWVSISMWGIFNIYYYVTLWWKRHLIYTQNSTIESDPSRDILIKWCED